MLTRQAAIVGAKYGLSVQALLAETTRHDIAHPRQHLMSVLRDEGYSWPSIGAALGLDHTTVIYGARRHAARVSARRTPA